MFLIREAGSQEPLIPFFSELCEINLEGCNHDGKSQSQNRLQWGTISSRNQPEMALYRTLLDLTFSHLQWDLGTRLICSVS